MSSRLSVHDASLWLLEYTGYCFMEVCPGPRWWAAC